MTWTSDRLHYHKFTSADLADYLQLATKENVMVYITGKALTEAEAANRFAGYLRTNQQHPEAGFFSVTTKATGAFVGLAKFVYTQTDQAEIGYSLLPDFWGQHYASELVQSLLHQATRFSHLTQLIALVNPANLVSVRVLTNHHFTRFPEPLPGMPSADCYVLARPFCR